MATPADPRTVDPEAVMRSLRAWIVAGGAMLCLAAVGGCFTRGLPVDPFGRYTTYTFVQAWGDSGSGDGLFYYPQGVAVDGSGHVYVVDTANRRIQKFTAGGEYLAQWGSAGAGPGQFGYMNSMAVAPGGEVYVADAGNQRIQKLSPDGSPLAEWGTAGRGEGEFSEHGPLAVALAPDGSVLVADTGNNRIQKFTADGAYLAQWGGLGSGNGRFIWPRGVGVDAAGNVYVADGTRGIQKFTGSGVFLRRWYIRGQGYWGSERMAVAGSGVFVTESYGRWIQKFSHDGLLQAPLALEGMSWSWTPAIAVDAAGNVYVTDTANHRILKFAPHPKFAATRE